tara:strand:- start:628 stop:972 length:345 start_codon:yes stop_codon:yes gene_type:complete
MVNFFKKSKFFLISIGAFPAAILRWQIDEIWIVNIIGCFLLGFINTLPMLKKYKIIFGIGFCGSLTTFSGWSSQLFQLITQGFYQLFFVNSVLMVLMGFCAVGLGHFFAMKLIN